MRATRHGLWLILALALAVRLAPMLFEQQIGRDIVEYQNLAENLRAHAGFFLDQKSYWLAPTPVVHYGLYERPILLPVLLAMLRLGLSPLMASQVLGPLLFLLTLALIYQTLRHEIGPGVAFSAGLLLALQPSLFKLSLMPVSEATTMLTMALIVWAYYRLRSEVITGLACSLAFLARPSMLLVAGILGLLYLMQSIRSRQPARVLLFAGFTLIGPLWLMAFNHAMGAPLMLLPQSFLFRVLDFQDGLHYFHRGPIYASALELLRAQWPEVTRLIGLHIFHYLRAIFSTEGLGLLVALMPLAVAGLWQARLLRRFRLLGLIALADFAFYVISWSTFDAARFLCLFYLLLVTLVVVGAHEVLDREPLRKSGRAWRSAAFYSTLAVAAVWLGIDGWHGYVAYSEWRRDEPASNSLKMLWRAPGVEELVRQLAPRAQKLDPTQPRPIVATNEPWMIYHKTGLPAAKIPYDLKSGEWLGHIRKTGASIVVLHLGDWPAEQRDRLGDLMTELSQGGWQPWFAKGEIQAWVRPKESPTQNAHG